MAKRPGARERPVRTDASAATRDRLADLVGLAVVLGVAAAMFAAWRDGVWMAADLGAYAHPAQRLLAGEVPGRDFEDVHNAGWVHPVNALALAWFGPDVLAIRWPLLIVVLAQAGFAYRWVLGCGHAWAVLAGVSVGIMSPILAPNPSANWYALVPTLVVIDRLLTLRQRGVRPTRRDLLLLGAVVGVALLVRQLSGVLLGLGLVSWLVVRESAAATAPVPPSRGRRAALRADRTLMAILLLGTLGYLLGRPHPGSVVLFGAAPAALLLLGLVRSRVADIEVGRLAGWLTLGGLLGVAPVALYHAVHGSMGGWLHDTVILSWHLAEMPFNANEDYVSQILYMLMAPATGLGTAQVPVSIAWVGRLLMTPVLGGVALTHLLRREGAMPDPLLWMAVFYGIGALHHEIPLYLLWALPPLLAAFHRYVPRARPRWRAAGLAWLAASVFVALRYDRPHTIWSAGAETVLAVRDHPWPETPVLPGVASVRVPRTEAEDYRRIVRLIQEHAGPGEAIFSFPTHPEFYVLADRPNATRYVFAGTSLYDEARVDALLVAFRRDPPAVILHDPGDKYNSTRTERLRAALDADYRLLETVRHFDILVRARPSRMPQDLP